MKIRSPLLAGSRGEANAGFAGARLRPARAKPQTSSRYLAGIRGFASQRPKASWGWGLGGSEGFAPRR